MSLILYMSNTYRIMVFCAISTALLMGCSTTHRTTQSERTAVEQLLISESVIRSLPVKSDVLLPIPSGSKVTLNTSGLTEDRALLQEVLTGWLGQQGYLIRDEYEDDASYRIDVIVSAMGTEENGTFFGLPPINSQIIPFSLPELAFYKSENQTGYVKFTMNVFETLTGKFIGSSPTFLADAYHNNYTVLLLVSFTSTDLMSPPQLGAFFHEPLNVKETESEDESEHMKEENSWWNIW